MRVVFDEEALDDLRHILEWISKDNPRAADTLVARIFDKAERLAAPELSQMGRPGLVEGTRELVEGPYIIVYKVFEDGRIVILTVAHGARDREDKA
ncbi:MAG: type II toxin-antitoxin system mRNA interferase toxin, RelE/StbE family [Rhizobiales bacterium]|nr:type II toxin-antitoxin system mRNA interferase toxin, RelE/StbE family [Hyphomicrobiales bacterium]